MILGTPSYMAPEQVTGAAVDHRADLFAVGAILYEMLVGRPPFFGRNMSDTLLQLTGPAPAAMQPVTAAGADAYVGVLQRALAKPPAQRFQSAEEFAAALPRTTPADPQATVALPSAGVPAAPLAERQWDPSLLQRVERALAQYVGPMARVVVAQAARESATTEQFYQTLAGNLQQSADRSAFLRALGGMRVEPSLAARTPGGQTAPGTAASAPGGPIGAEELAAAQSALAFFVGPIARVLVRRAASEAASSEDFVERLCVHVTRPDEAATLRRRLRAEAKARALPSTRKGPEAL
jgi:serine/threonine-protein kinase